MAHLAKRLKASLFAIEPCNNIVPAIEAGKWNYRNHMVCVHLALGKQVFALGATVQLAGLTGLGVHPILNERRSYRGIFLWPLCAAQGRHDKGMVASVGPLTTIPSLDGLNARHG